jgi:V/A-type H+-transporting ATPase subunit E
MVTIEQKLAMFSKLLHRSMNDKFLNEMDKLRKSYEIRHHEDIAKVNEQAEDILNQAYKRAEAEKTELISKGRISAKKKYMAAREELFNTLMEHLKDKINAFIRSDDYGEYLFSLVKMLIEEDPGTGSLIIYLTGADYAKYAELLKTKFPDVRRKDLIMKVADDNIIGGFIAEDPDMNIRMNHSIKALLEDNRSFMMETLFKALEVGEADGTE